MQEETGIGRGLLVGWLIRAEEGGFWLGGCFWLRAVASGRLVVSGCGWSLVRVSERVILSGRA